MAFKSTIKNITYQFEDLKTLLAKASPMRSGDVLAGLAADTYIERVAAQMVLADVPLKSFLEYPLVPYEKDEVTRLIVDTHDAGAFAPISHLTAGELRDWLLGNDAGTQMLSALAPGITPEMAAAVSKLMRNQDLIAVAKKCSVVTRFRNTIGLPGRFSARLQPNHPTDDPKGIAASIIDGLLYGSGDAVIGINPATDNAKAVTTLLYMIDGLREKYNIPAQSCVLSHVTTTLELMQQGVPVDLVFQSIGGTEKTNSSFGINLNLLQEAYDCGLQLNRGTV
ncbi:MAG TPA: ethanolamine ammonia-lyase subunit EutB, partial [Chitinophagaceae bacterium]|nr:ethanolamine ammonia-lyase subunit EutB [Chitinophagaceae bacterium]